MDKLKILGITGGVGAGKSTILSYLENKYHARTIQLDLAAHLLMQPGTRCCSRIIEAFGKEILKEDGTIDRQVLGQMVFGDRDKVNILNRIVHPAVKEYVREQILMEEAKGEIPFLVIEAALLLDDHYDEICDEIWYIYVNDEARFRRLSKSRGYSDEKTRAILSNQKSDGEFRRGCQFVVDNSSDFINNTYEQIDKGLTEHGFL